jgi:choline dehydrogenase-like flavoprotein
MALRQIDQTASPVTELSADFCVIGAGVAGLIAATRLAREKQHRVIVVESGLKQFDPSLDDLNEIEHPSDRYRGALTSRSRALGGTSLLWAGKLLPLTLDDTLCRPYLGLKRWPFDVGELDRYRREIEALMQVDDLPYEGDINETLDPDALLPRENPDFCLRWPKRPTNKNHNLAYVLRGEIESRENLQIWLGATVSKFNFHIGNTSLESITAINHAGKSLRVSASRYLIAAGTLESTRLLLLADRQSNHSITHNCDVLGRYFNDHLGLTVASLRPHNETLTNQMLSDRSTLNSLRHLHFELRPAVQKANKVASAYFDVAAELSDSSALTQARMLVRNLKGGRLAASVTNIGGCVRDLPSLLWTAQWQRMHKQKYWPPSANLSVKIWIEQLPKWNNRLSLSNHEDSLHLPRLKLDWEKTEEDEKLFRLMVEKIRRYWSGSLADACGLEWKPEVLDPTSRLVDLSTDLAHPAGSTRMGTNPLDSVVDPYMRVHRITNLSVASASVFPSSGSANPTFTIMHLAMRAADALANPS